ncbi:MAG TPA: MCP four helix bundle domain-containing protein, partial [Chryseosolibacter sp.]
MKLSIKTRLITAFVVLVALSAAIFYLGSSNAGVLNDRLNTIVDLNVKRIMLASKASEDIQLITKREKELVMTNDLEEIQEYIKIIEDRNTEMVNRIDQLKSMSDEKGAEILDGFTTKWNDYQKVYNKIKSLSLKNTDSTFAAAYKLSTTEGRQAAIGAIGSLSQILKKNEAALAQAKIETDALYDDAKRNMIILLVMSVVISVAISFWIITSISKS